MPPKRGRGQGQEDRGRGRGRGRGREQEQFEPRQPGPPRREFEERQRPPPQFQEQQRPAQFQEQRQPPQEQQRRPPQEQQRRPPQEQQRRPPQEQQHRPPQEHRPPRDVPPEAHGPKPGMGPKQKGASVSFEVTPTADELAEYLAGFSFERKYGRKFTMATRPDRGRNGRSIGLVANYFKLEFTKDISIYHYDVDIVFLKKRKKDEPVEESGKGPLDKGPPEGLRAGVSLMKPSTTAKEAAEKKVSHVEHQQKRAPGKQRCRQVIAEFIKSKALRRYNPVYDGQKNIYTTTPLDIKGKTAFIVSLDEDDRYNDFEVIVQPVEKTVGTGNLISLEPLFEVLNGRSKELPQEIIMALDTVMCHRMPPIEQTQVGRSFFMLNQSPYRLGEGIEIWFGYSQSVRLTERGPAVIVNFAAKAFHKAGSVIEYASEILKTDITKLNALNPRDIHALTEALGKVRVEVTHLRYPRKYAVKAVTKQAARDIRFDANGRPTTVAQYFQDNYNLRLRYPYLPCLHMRSNNNTTFIPMEVCKIVPNQPKLGKLSGRMTADMIKQTAVSPDERFKEIGNELQNIDHVSGTTMKEFGLRLDFRPMELQGRVIEPPTLTYFGADRKSACRPDPTGKWRMDGKRFLKSRDKCSWVLLNFTRADGRQLEKFASILASSAHDVGMGLERVVDIRSFGARDTVRQAIKYAKDCGVTFAVIVVSEFDKFHSYEEIKFVADIEFQLPTQCIKDKVVGRFNQQVATNLLLKINSKLGGVNHGLLQRPMFFSRPVIVFGADAAHSPRGYACPSIAALVGSLDAYPSRYAVTCRVQKNPDEKKLSQEIILDLKDMTKCILEEFKKNTRGKYPEKIIFFRDGVSEGQFSTVLEKEIVMVQEACNETLGGNVPPMTYIVVQKRHQTRFRPKNPRDGVGKMGNIPPGTTVDTEVTHPIFFDFFICSHEGIQGTSKPAHYTVIFDENKFSSDDLQQLCHHLCHMYARCNRSISIPPPVMYADLACTRAKKYADFYLNSTDAQSTVSSGSSGQRDLPDHVKDAINNTMARFDVGMFYV